MLATKMDDIDSDKDVCRALFTGGTNRNTHSRGQNFSSTYSLVDTPGNDKETKAVHTILSNGISVIIIHDPNSVKSAASLSVRVGALNDPIDMAGITHSLTHLLTYSLTRERARYGTFYRACCIFRF